MRILHTSDWHFGMPRGTDTYEADQRFFLGELYRIIEQEKADAVLVAGDVYDSSVSNADAIRLYNDAVTHICAGMGVPMVVIAGNHDSGARLAACRELLKGAGLYVTGRLTRPVEPVLLDGGRTAVYPVPFFGREEVAALYPEKRQEITSYEAAFCTVCDGIRETTDSGRCNILLAHAMVVRAELSESDRAARIGQALAVSRDVFAGFDYVALGHIHKPQAVGDTVRYSGSPVQYAFGAEERQEKSVVLFDTETREQKTVPLRQLHVHRTLTGTLEEVLAAPDADDAYVRVCLTDRFAGPETLGLLRERFPLLTELIGKPTEETGEVSALTLEELHSMDETDVLRQFFRELYDDAPNARKTALFTAALELTEKEADVG